jgi:hypothetical protein
LIVAAPIAAIAAVSIPTRPDPALLDLCQSIRREALRPELAQVDSADLLTVVLANLGDQTPELKVFFGEILPGDVPVPFRRATFKQGVSAAIGAPWQCAEFDVLWDGERIESIGQPARRNDAPR